MILAVTGLQRERRILAGPGVEVVAGGGDQARLEAEVERLAPGARGIISIGIAGALAPALRPGRWVVATAVHDRGAALPTDPDWSDWLVSRLPGAERGVLLGVDTDGGDGGGRRPSCAAPAMRSPSTWNCTSPPASPGIIACRSSPRASSPMPRTARLPPAARVGMKSDGGVDLPAVLRSLLLAPWQLPALIRTGLEAETAFRALLRGHRLLGPGFGGPDLGQLPPDMV